ADVVDDERVRVVVSVKITGEIAQVVRELMRLERARRSFQQLGIISDATDQRLLVRLAQSRDVAFAELAIVNVTLLLQLPEDAADARVRVLHVVDRILFAL